LLKKVIYVSERKIMSEIYKNVYLNPEAHWKIYDLSTKLLGFYEEQIQENIIKLVGLEKSQKLNDKKKVNILRFLNIRINDKKFRLKDLINIKKDILYLSSKHENSTELTLEDFEVEKKLRLQKELVSIKLLFGFKEFGILQQRKQLLLG
jgi:hypothetical protein